MIRVLIADDHAFLRSGIEKVLANCDGVEVVGAAETGAAAVSLAIERSPDVVLMDLEMPILDGIQATRQILDACPGAQIVVLTAFADRRRILAALDAGAIGYLLKDAEPAEVVAGVRAAAAGGAPLDPKFPPARFSPSAQRPTTRTSSPSASARCSCSSGEDWRTSRSHEGWTSARRR